MWGRKIFRQFINSINSERDNKSPGNDDFTAEFHERFSDELTPDLLDVLSARESLAQWF